MNETGTDTNADASTDTDTTSTHEPQPRGPQANGPLSDSVLRTMQEESERLARDLDEARAAAKAAHEANSMGPSGLPGAETSDHAPMHGDGPVDPPEQD